MLMLSAPPVGGPSTRIGGLPLMPAEMSWPTCSSCGGPMEFVAQVSLADTGLGPGLLLLFKCENQPGLCQSWDAQAGANRALVVPEADLAPRQPPELTPEQEDEGLEGYTLLPGEDGVRLEALEGNYPDVVGPGVLGLLGGQPWWLQADETPQCPCGQPMTFVVQLESSGGGGINFGDMGCGYGFLCPPCREARFLWQCC